VPGYAALQELTVLTTASGNIAAAGSGKAAVVASGRDVSWLVSATTGPKFLPAVYRPEQGTAAGVFMNG